LSEEIGVGLACWTCSQLLGTRWPGAGLRRVDAEAALTSGAGPIALPGGAGITVTSDGKRPDYFWIAYDARRATVLEVVVLECKGTHDSRHVYKQLGDAMHQVAAVTVAGGGVLTLQAFGAHLSNKRIQLYGVDPEGDDALAGAVAPRTTRTPDEPVVRELEDDTFEISQPAAFRRRLLDIAAAQLLCWAGLADVAQARLVGNLEPLQIDLYGLDHRETPIGTFVGVSADFPVDTGVGYETFFGLDKRVATGLIADDADAEADAFDDFARRAARSLAATRNLLDSAIEADVLRQAEAAAADELGAPSAAQATVEPSGAAGQLRRAGADHVALDDPQDEGHVAGATLDGLFLEVRVRRSK
jgi:hypothetical protein